MTGGVIKGRIVVTQTEDFEGTEVEIGINGCEMTHFKQVSSEKDIDFIGKFVFLNAGHTAHKFPQPLSPIGLTEYQFEFRTPEWLPPSCVYSADYQTSLFRIKYAVWA